MAPVPVLSQPSAPAVAGGSPIEWTAGLLPLTKQPALCPQGMAEDPGAHAEPLETRTANARRCLAPRSNRRVGRPLPPHLLEVVVVGSVQASRRNDLVVCAGKGDTEKQQTPPKQLCLLYIPEKGSWPQAKSHLGE